MFIFVCRNQPHPLPENALFSWVPVLAIGLFWCVDNDDAADDGNDGFMLFDCSTRQIHERCQLPQTTVATYKLKSMNTQIYIYIYVYIYIYCMNYIS